jgi:uncharacterized membrane protein YebE (DUF533 family)
MPYYPIPAVLGIVSNSILAVVFVVFNPTTLVLGAAWVALGVVAYVALNRYRESETEPESGPVTPTDTDTQLGEGGED